MKKAAGAAEEPEFEEANEAGWSEEEQALLNQGLAENPASMDKKERWKAIAAVVGTRNLKECAQRYKEVKENIIRKKQAEESARRALAEQVGEAANAAAAAAYEAALAAAQAELADAGDEVDDMLAASGKSGAGGAVSRADDGRAADRLVEAGIKADVTVESEVERIFAETAAAFGSVDISVACVG